MRGQRDSGTLRRIGFGFALSLTGNDWLSVGGCCPFKHTGSRQHSISMFILPMIGIGLGAFESTQLAHGIWPDRDDGGGSVESRFATSAYSVVQVPKQVFGKRTGLPGLVDAVRFSSSRSSNRIFGYIIGNLLFMIRTQRSVGGEESVELKGKQEQTQRNVPAIVV